MKLNKKLIILTTVFTLIFTPVASVSVPSRAQAFGFFDVASFVADKAAGLLGDVVGEVTGIDILGDIVGEVAGAAANAAVNSSSNSSSKPKNNNATTRGTATGTPATGGPATEGTATVTPGSSGSASPKATPEPAQPPQPTVDPRTTAYVNNMAAMFAAQRNGTYVDPNIITGLSTTSKDTMYLDGTTRSLYVTVVPRSSINYLHYSSSDTNVVTVNQHGLMMATGVGKAKITVQSMNSKKKTTKTITVLPQPSVTSVKLNKSTLTLSADGKTATLTATAQPQYSNQSVDWTSSDPAVATVNAKGVVTPVAPGTTTITVTTRDGNKTSTSLVTVKPVPVKSVTLNKKTLGLKAGESTGTLTATLNPKTATNKEVIWSSSNPEVATVDKGIVTPLAMGTTVITVKTVDGNKTATSKITVAASTVIPETPITPKAPLVTNDDTANTVSGMAVGLEYSLNGASYVRYQAEAFNAIDFSGNQTLLVRVAAAGINPAGPVTTLTFTTNPVTPAAPLVANDDTANTVSGMAVGMEYNLNGIGYVAYDEATFEAIDFSGNQVLLVRVAAAGINPAGDVTTLTFTMNKVTPIDRVYLSYDFETTEGITVIDGSGNSNHGTLFNEATINDQEGYGGGKALQLTGTGYLDLPNHLIKDLQSFMISMRFKTTKPGALLGYQNFNVGGNAGAGGGQYVPILNVDNDGQLYAMMYYGPEGYGTDKKVISSDKVDDGNWHQVVMVADHNSLNVYLDGKNIGSFSGVPSHFSMIYNQIGANVTHSRPALDQTTGDWSYFTGFIDDFVVQAPTVLNDDATNTVYGIMEGMEYSLDGAGYVAYDAATFHAIDLSGDHTLLVRVGAGDHPAGEVITLTFTAN